LKYGNRAAEIARKLFRIADALEEKRRYRFAEQLRGASLSMSNNIAEGSGSTSKREFIRFLDIARKSTFENASMLLIFAREQLIPDDTKIEVLQDLDELSRMITAFSKSLHE
jgi:four helix bundle protein